MASNLESTFGSFEVPDSWRTRAMYAYVGFILLWVLAPIAYVVPAASNANLGVLGQELYVDALVNSFELAATVAVIATVLTTVAARFYREVRRKNAYILFLTLPMFVPGQTHSLAVVVFAKEVGISLSFWTLTAAHVFYVFPFAFLMVLATMSGLPQNLLAAAEDLGATRFRAFFDVELPLVVDGVISGFLVSFLLSFNESARASVLGGQFETLSGVIESEYTSVGLTADVFALNVFMVAFALIVVSVIFVVIFIRR